MLRSLLSTVAAFAALTSLMSAPVPPEKEPDWMPAFRKVYELKEGEYVRRVAPPYIQERVDFSLDAYGPPKYPEADRDNRKDYEDGYKKWMTIFVDQEGRRLFRRMTISSAYLSDKPDLQRGDNLFEVSQAVQFITGYGFRVHRRPGFREGSTLRERELHGQRRLRGAPEHADGEARTGTRKDPQRRMQS